MLESFLLHNKLVQFQRKLLRQPPLSHFERVVWKCAAKMPAAELLKLLKGHEALQKFSVGLLEPQPLDFIATDENIVNLVSALQGQGQAIPADSYFCGGRSLAELKAAYAVGSSSWAQQVVVRSKKVSSDGHV